MKTELRYLAGVNRAELSDALSALAGQPCNHVYLLQNRRRFYLVLVGGLLIGLVTGVVIQRWLVATIVSVVLVNAAAYFSDRRIVGMNSTGLAQAKSSPFTARPTELLAPLRFAEVQVLNTGGHDTATFRINGTSYLGTKGSSELARALQSRQA